MVHKVAREAIFIGVGGLVVYLVLLEASHTLSPRPPKPIAILKPGSKISVPGLTFKEYSRTLLIATDVHARESLGGTEAISRYLSPLSSKSTQIALLTDDRSAQRGPCKTFAAILCLNTDFSLQHIGGLPLAIIVDSHGEVVRIFDTDAAGGILAASVAELETGREMPRQIYSNEIRQLTARRDVVFVDISDREKVPPEACQKGWCRMPTDELEVRARYEIKDKYKVVAIDCTNVLAQTCDAARLMLEAESVGEITTFNRGFPSPYTRCNSR